MPLDQNKTSFDVLLDKLSNTSHFKEKNITLAFNAESFGFLTQAIQQEFQLDTLTNEIVLEELYQEIQQNGAHAETAIGLLHLFKNFDRDALYSFHQYERMQTYKAQDKVSAIYDLGSNVSAFSGLVAFGVALASMMTASSVTFFTGTYLVCVGLLITSIFLNKHGQGLRDKAALKVIGETKQSDYMKERYEPTLLKNLRKTVKETMTHNNNTPYKFAFKN